MTAPAVTFSLPAVFSSASFASRRAFASAATDASAAAAFATAASAASVLVASSKHRVRCASENLRNALSSLVCSSASTAVAISCTLIIPTPANGMSALRSCGRLFSCIHFANLFIFAYTLCSARSATPPPVPAPAPGSVTPPSATPIGARFNTSSWSSAHCGTSSPASRNAAMAYGLQIILAWTSVSRDTRMPRMSATTRISMKSSSGMVLMLTTRMSSGRSASSGDTCASSKSIRVSKRM
mmetsp:Transcript_46116/g.73864  ORF Transcript_46116/g.73864 Transcript_46116/m.73864 type:complete len:241 (+) Transcript_46116:701-1423(+)